MRRSVPLLERGWVLDRVGMLAARACEGDGRLLVLEGATGIGKSRLLGAVRELAAGEGLRTLSAVGDRLAQSFPWGVARQLFEPALSAADPETRAALLAGAAHLATEPLGLGRDVAESPAQLAQPAQDAGFPALHGLYWLCANLAGHQPLLLGVDDVQWADGPSRRFLSYLARRIGELPVLCVVTTTGEEPEQEPLLADSATLLFAETIRLGPLSPEAAASVVRAGLEGQADEEFCVACHRATGGNPYFLVELILSLQDSGLPPTAANAALVGDLGPATVAQLVLQRLRHVSEAAVALAEAVVVLGPDASLARAAALAGLDAPAAAAAADALVAHEVLAPPDHGSGRPSGPSPLRFAQAIVGSSISASLRPADRARRHQRAARILWEEGAEPERVATHLLAAQPDRQAWAVAALQEAARRALARGAPEAAVTYLQRALEEPPDRAERGDLLSDLGMAEARIGAPDAIDHLRTAVQLAEDVEARIARMHQLVQVLVVTQGAEEIGSLMAEALSSVPPDDVTTRLTLEASFVTMARAGGPRYLDALDHLSERRTAVGGDTPSERVLLAAIAGATFTRGEPASVAVELATKAWGEGRLLQEQTSESLAVYQVAWTLAQADEAAMADRLLQAALDDARRRGSRLGFSLASGMRAYVHGRFGSLAEAQADAAEALATRPWPQWISLPVIVGVLVEVMVECGDLATAAALLRQHGLEGSGPETPPFQELLLSRIRLRLATGDVALAVEDALEVERQRDMGLVGPLGVAVTTLALLAGGRHEEARERAARNLALARTWGAATAVGKATRALALAEGGEGAVEGLREAVATLERSPARLELARALIDLGAHLRRRGRKLAAREPLRRALHLTTAAGATVLADAALLELRAAGGRPRTRATSGVDALTAMERRVAEMATTGLTNRDIAQALFVTTRTVEGHLTHAYQKLGITSRAELGAALKEG